MARRQGRLCLSLRFCGCGVIGTGSSGAGCYLGVVGVAISVLESHAQVYVYESVLRTFLFWHVHSSLERGFKPKHDPNVGLVISHVLKIAI